MRWVHRCLFCGWCRDAVSATLLAPTCERCGCVLQAVDGSAVAGVTGPVRRAIRWPRPLRRAANVAALAALAGVVAAAAALGYNVAGPASSAAAAGAVGFALALLLRPRT
jgi:hypothetical protein